MMNAMTPETRKKRRTQKTVDVSALTSCQKRLGLSNAEFVEALGYGSPTTMTDWIRAHRAPQVAALAAEALVRRQAPHQSEPDRVFMLRLTKGAATLTELNSDVGTVTLNGASFYLIPQT